MGAEIVFFFLPSQIRYRKREWKREIGPNWHKSALSEDVRQQTAHYSLNGTKVPLSRRICRKQRKPRLIAIQGRCDVWAHGRKDRAIQRHRTFLECQSRGPCTWETSGFEQDEAPDHD
jgi:hypothetical protein